MVATKKITVDEAEKKMRNDSKHFTTKKSMKHKAR